MNTNTTLLEFLEACGARLSVYDMGRRVAAISRATFLDIERGAAPYPLPMQRKAWFALLQQPETTPQSPVIWFLCLDLDEQGLLVQAERDYLLNRLLESGQAQSQGDDPQVFLQDNPYAFTPRDDRMALFHARLSVDLGLPPSRFYEHALDYFHGRPGWDQWSFLGYQGIADVARRHPDAPLTIALPELPKEPLVALCHCLEGTRPSAALVDALTQRLQDALTQTATDVPLIAALIRALAAEAEKPAFRKLLRDTVGQHPAGRHIELLAAISGRAWEALEDEALLNAYLLNLANNEHGQPAFESCLSDLLSLPGLAPQVRGALRKPTQAVAVRSAFGRMTDQNQRPGSG